MNKILLASILSVALMTGCGNRPSSAGASGDGHTSEAEHGDHDGHDHEAEGHDHEAEEAGRAGHDHGAGGDTHAGEIVFTKAQAAQTDFELFEVQPVTFNEVIPTSGRIMAAQGDEASVVAPVGGVVSFTNKKIADGTPVGRGETLFTISSKEMAEGDYVARTRSTYEQAKAAFERAENLVKDKIISQSDYEQSRLAYENAKTAYDAVAGKTSVRGTRVTAPIGGFIKNVAVSEGAFVEVGQTLATVSQNKRLVLRAEVSQRYLNDLRSVSGANFRTPDRKSVV